MRRVVQFSTGNVGQHSLKAIIGRPDLELVGLHAASPEQDRARRVGTVWARKSRPASSPLTTSTRSLRSARLRRLHRAGETRPMEALEQMSNSSRRESTSRPRRWCGWCAPPRRRLADGTAGEGMPGGQSSLYVNGIDPGFSGDTEVHSALSLSTRVDSVTVQEIFDYANYDDYEFTGVSMGFGLSRRRGSAAALPAGRPHDRCGAVRCATSQTTSASNSTSSGSASNPGTPTKRIECKMATVEPGRWPRSNSRSRGTRRGPGDHHRTRHPADAAAAPDWEYPPDGKHRCAPRHRRGRTAGRTQHSRVRSGPRRHRGRMRLHRRPGGQRHRLALQRAAGLIAVEDMPLVGDHPRADVG